MKHNAHPNHLSPIRGAALLLASLGLLALGSATASAQTYAARVSSTSTTVFDAPCYWIANGGTAYSTSTGKSGAPGTPTRVGCYFHTMSTAAVGEGFGVNIVGDTAVGDGVNVVYLVEVTQPSSNVGTDNVVSLVSTNCSIGMFPGAGTTSACTSFNSASSANIWASVCWLTNNVGATNPSIQFLKVSGVNNRIYADCVRFTKVDQCQNTAAVGTTGPISTNVPFVTVTGVSASAAAVKVYQKVGAGSATLIGTLTTGIVAGDNSVPVSGMVKGAQVVATQTLNSQEGCVTFPGKVVGGGPNPRIRVSWDMRSAGDSGPIGTAGAGTGGGLFFMPGIANSTTIGGGIVVNTNTCWQTVKIDPRTAIKSLVWSGVGSGGAPAAVDWAELESLAFQMDDTSDTGPYAIYIDNVANGTNMLQDFEASSQGDGTLFWKPNTAGFPVGCLINPPNISGVTNDNASAGANSDLVNFQFSGGTTANWVRLVAGNPSLPGNSYPQVDMHKPIYFDILVLPAGTTVGHSIGAVGYMDDTTNCPGDNITFSVPTNGTALYTYVWKRNGGTIAGATDATFTTNGVTPASAGTYSVTVSDGTCSLTRDAILAVIAPAQIDNQPTDSTVNVGDPALFSVGASTVAPCVSDIGYQWKKNGVNIPNETNATISIASAQVADAGIYSVAVTNAFVSLISSNAILHVVDVANQFIGSGSGLLGEYYNNPSYAGTTPSAPFSPQPATVTRVDSTIDFNWGTGSPDPLVTTDYFAVRWTGKIQGEWNQNYTFYTTSDDGVRLWINHQLVINSWTAQAPTEHSGNAALTTNAMQDIVLEYYEKAGGAVASLSWESASQVKSIVPATQLYPGTAPAVPTLNLTRPDATHLTLTWNGSYVLQTNTSLNGGTWGIVPGAADPYTVTINPAAPQVFFRLLSQ